STAFISYGVQRVAIPEKEIREKLAYSFGRQVVLRILYNNWDGCFLPNARSFSANDFVDTRRENWRVTREHLYLDRVEEAVGQATHPTYEIEWREELLEEERLARTMPDKNQWLTEFDKGAETVWQRGFRSVGTGGGVEDYFANRRDPMTLRARARDLRAIVETDLLQSMERGDQEYVLYHLPDALDILLERIAKDRKHFGELVSTSQEEIEKKNKRRDYLRGEYTACESLTHLLFKNKVNTLFNEYRDATTSYYYWRTVALAAQYGQEFCAALISELKSLSEQITLFKSRMLLVAKNFEAEMRSRIVENEEKNSTEEVDYLVDVKYVNATIHERFECNKSVQDHHATNTVKSLVQLRQKRTEFAAYTEIMPVDNSEQVGGPLVNELRRVADQSAGEAHRRIREEDKDFHGIFGQNIIQKMYNDYGGQVNDEMRYWLRETMSKAMPMVSFEANEEPMDLGSDVRAPVLRRCVFITKCKAVPQKFSQDLRQTIESITGDLKGGGVVETYCQDIPEDRNSSEISILSVAFFFPARFTRTVHGLQEKYLRRLDQLKEKDARRAYFEVHTESHRPRLPSLMKEGRIEVLKERLAPVLLATALDLMWIPENNEQVVFGTEEAYNTGGDMVESGLSVSAELREKATAYQSKDEEISLEITLLHSAYLSRFNENSLDAIEGLVGEKMKEKKELGELENRLNSFRAQAFFLSQKKREDATFILFKDSVDEATELSRRLAEELV
ncbi:MAG: hypothetical protein D3906_01885, partial [Candidatus Electrothrix sp. AUS1_2]|nr:hypothetical protein [Candidatus Electrothrix sp. AUS1_2]